MHAGQGHRCVLPIGERTASTMTASAMTDISFDMRFLRRLFDHPLVGSVAGVLGPTGLASRIMSRIVVIGGHGKGRRCIWLAS